MVSLHYAYDKIQAAGGLLLVDTGRLEVVAPPPETPLTADEKVTLLDMRVADVIKNYLSPRAAEDDPSDLVGFWRSATSFYSDVNEHHTLGRTFLELRHDRTIKEILFGILFDPDSTPRTRKRRGR